jgi:hypothetical protein
LFNGTRDEVAQEMRWAWEAPGLHTISHLTIA